MTAYPFLPLILQVAAHAPPASPMPYLAKFAAELLAAVTVVVCTWLQTRHLKKSHESHERTAEDARNAVIETQKDVLAIKEVLNGNGKADK